MLETILLEVGKAIGAYLVADDFMAARRLLRLVVEIRESKTPEQIQVERLTALMSGIAAHTSQAATSARARKKP